jgi:hypothetical protein
MTQADAAARLDRFAQEFMDRNPQDVSAAKEWLSPDVLAYTVSALGIRLSGTATVTESEILVETTVPFMARPFTDQIKHQIEETLAKTFA